MERKAEVFTMVVMAIFFTLGFGIALSAGIQTGERTYLALAAMVGAIALVVVVNTIVVLMRRLRERRVK